MSSKLRTAVIGVGNMGKNHARIYAETSQLVGVADIDSQVGKTVANRYNTTFYRDYHKMLQVERPEAVSVAVPTSQHRKVTVDCLKRQIPTLVEKPIADTLKNGRIMVKEAEINKTLLVVGHIERYNPAVRKLKEIIDNKDVGNVISIIARRLGGLPPRTRDVSIAVDLAIHDIDIANYLLNRSPTKIITFRKSRRENSVEFFLRYESTSVYLQANWNTPVKIRKLNVSCTKGYIEMDYIKQQIVLYKNNYKNFRATKDNYSDYIRRFSEPEKIDIHVDKKEPLKEEITYFFNCVKNNIKEGVEYALTALRIAQT